MPSFVSSAKRSRLHEMLRFGLLAACASLFTAVSTPVSAGGGGYGGAGYYYGGGQHFDRGYSRGFHGRGFYNRGFHGRGFYGGRGYYGGHRYFGGRGYHRGGGYDHGRGFRGGYYRRGGFSGGDAALVALGVVGGAILIDRALEDRRYEDRRYEDRRYDDRRFDDLPDRRRGAFDDDYYYQRDARPYEDEPRLSDSEPGDAGAPEELLGAGPVGRPSEAVGVRSAFRECVAETRGAAGAGGLDVAMPGAPTEIQELADGSVRMIAQFRASNGRGQEWTRRFVCEADERGVRFLQVD